MGILVAEACDRAFPPMLSETLRERLETDGFGQQMVEELVEGRWKWPWGHEDEDAMVGEFSASNTFGTSENGR